MVLQRIANHGRIADHSSESECGHGDNKWLYAGYVFDLLWQYLSNDVQACLLEHVLGTQATSPGLETEQPVHR